MSEMNLSDDDGQKQFADYNKLCIDKGFEGIMVKPIDGPYECKRSSLMVEGETVHRSFLDSDRHRRGHGS